EHAAERLIANGNLNRLPCVHDFAAAHDTIGRTQADCTHEAIAEVLSNFQRQGFFRTLKRGLNRQRIVHIGHGIGGELHLPHGSHDAGDTTVCLSPALPRLLFHGGSHFHSLPDSASALAPPTISLISWVIPACRAWLAI